MTMFIDHESIAAVVVTYNRSQDLVRSIEALEDQTHPLDWIIVVDNASTDNTAQILKELKQVIGRKLIIISSRTNGGGAGGYYCGMKKAMELNADRLWLLDDDAVLAPDALDALVQVANSSSTTFCSTAISSRDKRTLCWPPSRKFRYYEDLQVIERASFAPFLGFYIHASTIKKIGLPNALYFISGDDFEYSIRHQKLGEPVVWVKASKIYHPEPVALRCQFGRFTIKHLILPPWRRFYDVRNRIWTARKHYSAQWVCLTIISIACHGLLSLVVERNKRVQMWSYLRGIYEGLKKNYE